MTDQPIIVQAILVDGDMKPLAIPSDMLGKIAMNIRQKGSEQVHTLNGSYDVAGLVVYGKKIGERVIVIGSESESSSPAH